MLDSRSVKKPQSGKHCINDGRSVVERTGWRELFSCFVLTVKIQISPRVMFGALLWVLIEDSWCFRCGSKVTVGRESDYFAQGSGVRLNPLKSGGEVETWEQQHPAPPTHHQRYLFFSHAFTSTASHTEWWKICPVTMGDNVVLLPFCQSEVIMEW